MGYATQMAFVGWTATQTQSINQDINGTLGISTASWSSMGAFTDYVDATGVKPIIPEAATVMQVGVVLLIWLGRAYWLRGKSRPETRVSAATTH